MAINFNPANTIARAYTRPKIVPARADVSQTPVNDLVGTDNRREAPAVQLRLSPDALAVLAKARQDAEPPTSTRDPKPTRQAGKTEFSFGELFSKLIEDQGPEKTPPAPAREQAANGYAPPGSRVNIVL